MLSNTPIERRPAQLARNFLAKIDKDFLGGRTPIKDLLLLSIFDLYEGYLLFEETLTFKEISQVENLLKPFGKEADEIEKILNTANFTEIGWEARRLVRDLYFRRYFSPQYSPETAPLLLIVEALKKFPMDC